MQMLKTMFNVRGSYLELATLLLRIAVALSCLGYASQTLRQKTPLNTEVLLNWGTAPYLATLIPILFALAFLVLGALAFWKPTTKVLWSIFTMIALLTSMKFLGFGLLFGLTLPSHAARYLAPVGLLMLMKANKRNQDPSMIFNMLRISIALTFFGHGVKGLFHSSNFLHLMQGTEMTLFGAAILSPEMNLFILDAIGVVDLLAAVLILTSRWHIVAIYMALWTFAAAWTRVTANGIASWDDIVIRAAYYMIPLAIICYYNWLDSLRVRESVMPTHESAWSPVGAD